MPQIRDRLNTFAADGLDVAVDTLEQLNGKKAPSPLDGCMHHLLPKKALRLFNDPRSSFAAKLGGVVTGVVLTTALFTARAALTWQTEGVTNAVQSMALPLLGIFAVSTLISNYTLTHTPNAWKDAALSGLYYATFIGLSAYFGGTVSSYACSLFLTQGSGAYQATTTLLAAVIAPVIAATGSIIKFAHDQMAARQQG